MVIQDIGTTEAFEARIAEVGQVEECFRLFGQPDYLRWVAVAGLAAYERVYLTTLTHLPDVARTNLQFQ